MPTDSIVRPHALLDALHEQSEHRIRSKFGLEYLSVTNRDVITHKYHALGRRTTRTADRVGNHISFHLTSARGDGDGRAETTHTATVRHTRAPSAHLLRYGDGPTRSASSPRSSGVVGGHVLPWGPRRAPQSITSSPRCTDLFVVPRNSGSLLHQPRESPAVCLTDGYHCTVAPCQSTAVAYTRHPTVAHGATFLFD